MSYQEKNSIISIFTSIIIFGIFFIYTYNLYQSGNYTETNIFKFWGIAFLILIPIQIASRIIIAIIFSIVNTIATKEEEDLSFTDERDKLIELKATRNSSYVFMVGFLIAMGSLALGKPPLTMFFILIFSCFISEISSNISQLFYYRRGV